MGTVARLGGNKIMPLVGDGLFVDGEVVATRETGFCDKFAAIRWNNGRQGQQLSPQFMPLSLCGPNRRCLCGN